MSNSTKYSSRLPGHKVLIFGGSSGLGYAAAEACVENEMTVVIASSSNERVDNAIERILKEYPSAKDRVSGYACNLGDQATLEENIVRLLEKVGRLDHIIYSAGDSVTNVSKPLNEITVEAAISSHMVRYFAPMIIAKHAPRHLSAGPHSSITLTSGAITLRPIPDWVLANGVMSALQGLAQQLALELAPVRVNVVQPGFVVSEMWGDGIEERKGAIRERLLTRRLALPEDVAEAYLYTLKDVNLTGAVIKTDGGADLM